MVIHASGGSGCCFAIPRSHLVWFHANKGFLQDAVGRDFFGLHSSPNISEHLHVLKRPIKAARNRQGDATDCDCFEPIYSKVKWQQSQCPQLQLRWALFWAQGWTTNGCRFTWVGWHLLAVPSRLSYSDMIYSHTPFPNRHIWNSLDSPEPSALENKTCVQLCEQNMFSLDLRNLLIAP